MKYEQEEQIEETLRRARNRMPHGYEGVTHRTPLGDMLAKDPLPDLVAMTEEQLCEHAENNHIDIPPRAKREELLALIRGEYEARWEQRMEGMLRVFDYVFGEGPHPVDIIRRILAMAKAIRPELLLYMSCEDVAVLSGDGGRATVSARINRIYSKLIQAVGMKGSRAGFQKSEAASHSYKVAQCGNQNRRGKKFMELNGQLKKEKPK